MNDKLDNILEQKCKRYLTNQDINNVMLFSLPNATFLINLTIWE